MRVRWEPERLYWCVLDAPGWRRAGPLPEGLRPEVEDLVPLAPGEAHAVCVPAEGGRVVVCTAAREALAALPAGTDVLAPASLPVCIDASIDPAALNLLVGEFEPAHRRRGRTRGHLLAAAVVLLCCGLVAAGLVRRAQHWGAVADRAREARAALTAETVPGRAGDPHALLAELAQLRAAAEGATRVRPPRDAALALADLLRAWPAAVPSEPQSLSVSQAGAVVSVALEGDPAPFLAALKPPPGWTAAEPRLNASGGITRATLQFALPVVQGRAAP